MKAADERGERQELAAARNAVAAAGIRSELKRLTQEVIGLREDIRTLIRWLIIALVGAVGGTTLASALLK